ncbi:tail fiber domain-containing protein [[Clostridium] innocuum]|uniref:Tail fiber domain-containing protein n=2 Tax=Clostridium innocuum TaxID=1522 RepID=A0AAP2XUG6_CLOIN|nr:tail fiber domain-containing protein [[Clostridium] innocuum]MCR0226195.1 tail fiber domain-containing protein [[Clostridium] innocuum]MCR0235557.1 tail fiber domain-containing protein [[Clostridium] innocuum]MCR0380752.1 tail fiber domain-containing protein [[Clostridium] innocuum]MCR0451844.1 tail fiber domain-containing protein [[Clostridium] innocuum]MCR0499368.1 tail fiber domain-containing protein [[Clostridium] innocuum]
MITTSDKYKTAISKSGRHFRLKIDIAGTAYTGIKSFKLKGGTNSSEQITFGDAVSSYIEFILTDVPKNTILKGRQAIPYIGLELDDGTVEWIKKGVYNLEKPVRSGEFIKLTAYDNFALCYKGFFTALSGNQKIVVILQEQCKKIGIEYAGGADDVAYNVDTLQGLTIIEAVSVLASYCGKNAIMDKDGKLRLVWYTDAGLTISPSRFADPLEMDEEDTFMNRLDCAIDEEHSVSAGTGVGIYFSCPGMTQERITVLYNRIKGFTYRAAKLNWRMAQPDVEAGDLVRVMDNAGNAYVIPLMDYEFNCDGGFYGTIESKGKTQQEQDTGYKGPLQTKVDRTYSDLVSTKQVITDKITAFEGEFETINTNYLEVNKKLSALDAEIENLDVTELATKVAKIETSYVSKEYVQDLYATKAEVHVLDVDLERVNTLLAGSVTAGSTQTIVLNADNTTISNALIKSAMIDSLSADKVTAGTIDASSIHFKSQSGRLDIFGETLQVKDATRTRVQIGKDGTGDYALSQWDAQGNLMWDSRGAKAAAIKDKIIVNDMVSDNAGIEGKKINITSLVKEINDGTEVIKSSHILVDGANQSLSVVYNTITGDLSTLSTALSVEQGKISSLITDVSQAKGDVSTLQTNYSSLTQTVSGINSTVSSHSTSIDNLNNMEIGGRNLITNTRPDKPTINAMTSKWSVQIIEESTAISGKAMQATCVLGGTGGVYHGGSRRLETGKRYTWMVFVKASKQVRIGLGNEQNGILYCDITTEWNKFTHTFTANNNTHYQFIFYTANADNPWMVGDIISYHSLILVEGDKAPTWVPAPEDVDASIKTVSDKTSTLEQTVNGFSGRISSIETTANNASSKVTEITATVNGLTTTVANKTDKGAIISTINQSAEAIKIQASKLELTGYVTMTNLSTSGQTSIDGGNIKTRTITAAKIASGTITATQIAANTITGAKIASKTITADKISVTSLSVLTANLGTVTAGSLTSNTTISVSTNLTVGNNIYLNQNVNTTKYIYFNSSNYIRNLYTNSYNYITVNSNYRCALMSGSTSVYAYGNTGEAGISAAASIIFSSYGNGRLEHYGKYYDANWSSGFFRPLQAGTALGGSGASYRWYRLYAANTCSTSSDIRLKTNVKKYDVRYESMYMDLKPVTYELISTPGKTQCGLIAQWVKEAMDKNGISENEFALYEHDIREDSYSISYEQLTSLNMHMVQKTIKRVDAIDDELLSIKASRQQDAQELQQELQKRDFEISQLQYRIQQLESRS